jgi:hypothetical protein
LVILIVGSFCVISDFPAEFEVGINKCRRFSVKTNPEPTTERVLGIHQVFGPLVVGPLGNQLQ